MEGDKVTIKCPVCGAVQDVLKRDVHTTVKCVNCEGRIMAVPLPGSSSQMIADRGISAARGYVGGNSRYPAARLGHYVQRRPQLCLLLADGIPGCYGRRRDYRHHEGKTKRCKAIDGPCQCPRIRAGDDPRSLLPLSFPAGKRTSPHLSQRHLRRPGRTGFPGAPVCYQDSPESR